MSYVNLVYVWTSREQFLRGESRHRDVGYSALLRWIIRRRITHCLPLRYYALGGR